MYAIQMFTAAVTANELDRAAGIASVLVDDLKDVAREIWTHAVPSPAPF